MDFIFSKHALERIQDMLLDPEEVRKALFEPEETRLSKNEKHLDKAGDPVYFHFSGRITLTVIHRRNGKRVVTSVLWRSQEGWREDIETYGPYGGREIRDAR